jgi:hypothetical protein
VVTEPLIYSDASLKASLKMLIYSNVNSVFSLAFASSQPLTLINQSFLEKYLERPRDALLISPAAHHLSLQRMGIDDQAVNVGTFSDEQKYFLNYHREEVFLEARISQ